MVILNSNSLLGIKINNLSRLQTTLVSTRDRLPLWRLAYRQGGVLRGHISLAANRRDDVGGRGREMEEEGDLDD